MMWVQKWRLVSWKTIVSLSSWCQLFEFYTGCKHFLLSESVFIMVTLQVLCYFTCDCANRSCIQQGRLKFSLVTQLFRARIGFLAALEACSFTPPPPPRQTLISGHHHIMMGHCAVLWNETGGFPLHAWVCVMVMNYTHRLIF